MTDRWHWRDAEQAATWLRHKETDRRILFLLARLPLLDVWVLQRLAGLRGGASLYRTVSRLREARLIEAIHPPLYPHHSPKLFYLTDLGLATVALLLQADPRHLADRLHLRGEDLLALVTGLPSFLALYELLGGVAASQPGRPSLLAWERPWHRHAWRPTAKTPVSVTLPAYAALSWDGVTHAYLLLPDRGTFPLRLYRPTLDRFLIFRCTQSEPVPTLVIGTHRAAAWDSLLDEMRQARHEVPLDVHLADWDALDTSLHDLGEREQGPVDPVVYPLPLRPLGPRCSSRPLPRFVGNALKASLALTATNSLGLVALTVTPKEHELLELVGRHPFLTPGQLAIVLGWQVASLQRRHHRLIALGLLRLLEVEEIGEEAARARAELTVEGLQLVAAHLDLSLPVAVRKLGLTGGGPDQPLGPRCALLRTLTHTLAADEVFVRLYHSARQLAAEGRDDAVIEWQNATACSRRHLRPDGYGIYRRHGVSHGFFLELDRGTMNARDYLKKLTAYYEYGMSRRFERDYQGYPTVLVVAANNATEERIVCVVRAVTIGCSGRLPLLLTCHWRIDEPGNPDGLLGPIWREADAAFDDRRCWPRSDMPLPPARRIVDQRDMANHPR